MLRIEKGFSKTNVPKAIRFADVLDAKLSALAKGEHISFK